jgi:hypothetical protein
MAHWWLTWKDQVLVSLVHAPWVVERSGSVDTVLFGQDGEHDQQIEAGVLWLVVRLGYWVFGWRWLEV